MGLEPLPYSLDFMPIEHLRQWLRENITYLPTAMKMRHTR